MYRNVPPGRLRRTLYSGEFQTLPLPNITADDVYDIYSEHNRYIQDLEDFRQYHELGGGIGDYDYGYDEYTNQEILNANDIRRDYGMPPLIEYGDTMDLIDFNTEINRPSLPRLNMEGMYNMYYQTIIDIPEPSLDHILNQMEYGMSDTYENLSLLEDVKVGLISEKILRRTTLRNSEDVGFCIICQEGISLCIERELNCKHRFHVDCIDTWLSKNNKCPMCREEI